MARAAVVLTVLVSSPSDVAPECATVVSAIRDWNSSYSRDVGIVLEPVQWQTHAYPESGDRPQAIINRQIVDESDMVVAVFGHRIGTATGTTQSGTIEEIEHLRGKGKYVAVYFSSGPIPRNHDPEQLRRLNEYRESLKQDTLYWNFESTEELYRLVSQHLARSVSRLYQELRSSGTIRVLASQLPGVVGGPELTTQAGTGGRSLGESFTLQHVFVGEFPEGPTLRLTANRQFRVTQIDYLDENGARVSSENPSTELLASKQVHGKGQQLEVLVDHAKLIQIHNLKPRSGHAAIPMQFRLHLAIDDREEVRTIPALLEPSFKNIQGTTTYFMKVIG
jgi:hypothetical protein